MNAYFPMGLSVTVIAALEVEMVGKLDDYIDAPSGVINELDAVLLMAVAVGGSVRWRSMSALITR